MARNWLVQKVSRSVAAVARTKSCKSMVTAAAEPNQINEHWSQRGVITGDCSHDSTEPSADLRFCDEAHFTRDEQGEWSRKICILTSEHQAMAMDVSAIRDVSTASTLTATWTRLTRTKRTASVQA